MSGDQPCCPRHRSRIRRARLRHRFRPRAAVGDLLRRTRAAVPIEDRPAGRSRLQPAEERAANRDRSIIVAMHATFAGWPRIGMAAVRRKPDLLRSLLRCRVPTGSPPVARRAQPPRPSVAARGHLEQRQARCGRGATLGARLGRGERRGGVGTSHGRTATNVTHSRPRSAISLASDAHASRRLAITLHATRAARSSARRPAAPRPCEAQGCHLLPRPARAGSPPTTCDPRTARPVARAGRSA